MYSALVHIVGISAFKNAVLLYYYYNCVKYYCLFENDHFLGENDKFLGENDPSKAIKMIKCNSSLLR